MKQIASVIIENFQSHARSELSFAKGLNVIIGPSDNGKSAVLRAIRWALYNEPRGSEFVRSGSRECRVTITMSDGVEVVRELLLTKSGATGRSRYIVRAPGQEPQVFEGFGTEPPEEVVRAHGMPQVLLDTDRRVVLSFGSQLEGPFLMAETGSLRARAIGRLLGVHVVDAAMRNTQRDLRTVKTEVSRLEREVERYDRDLQPYADIPEQEARLLQAEALLNRAQAVSRRLQRLESLDADFARGERESIMVEASLGRMEGLDRAQEAVRHAEDRHRDGARLERLGAEVERMEQESQQARSRIAALASLARAEEGAREAAERQSRLTALSRIDGELRRREGEAAQATVLSERLHAVPRATDLLQAAGGALQRLGRLQEQAAQVADVDKRVATGMDLLRKTEADLQQGLREYEAVLRRLGKCPSCMQPVEAAAIPRILAELAGGPPSGHAH
jgi:exonuclease SbcC